MSSAKRLNCWEFRNCGLEPGGIFARLQGPCPVAANSMKYDGVNDGRGAGRMCWRFLQNKSRNIHTACRFGRISCQECQFYRRVHNEENIEIFESQGAPA